MALTHAEMLYRCREVLINHSEAPRKRNVTPSDGQTHQVVCPGPHSAGLALFSLTDSKVGGLFNKQDAVVFAQLKLLHPQLIASMPP